MWLARLLSPQPATSLLNPGGPGGSQQLLPDSWEGFCEEQLPHSMATAWVGRGWFIFWVDWWLRHVGIFCATLGAWWPLRNGSTGVGPAVAPQPTWAHVRKAGISRTGTFLVSAFTRRLRSSVNSTTSRSSRMGSSLLAGMKSFALSLQ